MINYTNIKEPEFKVGDDVKFCEFCIPTYGVIIKTTPKFADVKTESGDVVRIKKTKLNWD